MTMDKAEQKQEEFDAVLNVLRKYVPRRKEYINAKDKLSNKAKTFYKGREKIIEGFKNEIFPFLSDDGRFKDKMRMILEVTTVLLIVKIFRD